MHDNKKKYSALCRNFCAYYKPGKNEELECQGSIVVRGLVRRGRQVPLEKPVFVAAPGREAVAELQARLCGVCSFRDGDCDYVLTDGTAQPCGGFALLSHLIGCGQISFPEIDEVD